ESEVVPAVLQCLREGGDAAIVSDAGTPVLSDPGFELVLRVREAGLQVASVPGPSAFAAALAASGQPPLPAVLIGFLPPKQGQRRRRLAEPIMSQATTVVFLSPHRLGAELLDAAEILGEDRPATLLAELSKKHERAEMGTLKTLAAGREVQKPRGEYVLVIGPPPSEPPPSHQPGPPEAQEAYLAALDVAGERREAMRIAARELRLSRREFYALLLENEDL
ncbi:MAG: SAM-dependent methyltransferase, partial [Acidobacteriota bacterium]